MREFMELHKACTEHRFRPKRHALGAGALGGGEEGRGKGWAGHGHVASLAKLVLAGGLRSRQHKTEDSLRVSHCAPLGRGRRHPRLFRLGAETPGRQAGAKSRTRRVATSGVCANMKTGCTMSGFGDTPSDLARRNPDFRLTGGDGRQEDDLGTRSPSAAGSCWNTCASCGQPRRSGLSKLRLRRLHLWPRLWVAQAQRFPAGAASTACRSPPATWCSQEAMQASSGRVCVAAPSSTFCWNSCSRCPRASTPQSGQCAGRRRLWPRCS